MVKRWYLQGFILNQKTHDVGLVITSRPSARGFYARILVLKSDGDSRFIDSYDTVACTGAVGSSSPTIMPSDLLTFVAGAVPGWDYVPFVEYISKLGHVMTFMSISRKLGRTKMTLSHWHSGHTRPDLVRTMSILPDMIQWLRDHFVKYDTDDEVCADAQQTTGEPAVAYDIGCTTPAPGEYFGSTPAPDYVSVPFGEFTTTPPPDRP